jgi:hypothetical protein
MRGFILIEVTDPVVTFHFKLLPENTSVNSAVPYRTRNRIFFMIFMIFTLKPQHCEAEYVYMHGQNVHFCLMSMQIFISVFETKLNCS